MANYTTNLNLEKPLQTEVYDVDIFNANADKIDAFAGQIPARALTADKLTAGAKINGVNFKGDSDITLSTVNLTGNQTVAGVKTFSDTIQGTANKAIKDQNGDVIDTTYVKAADFEQRWHAAKGYLDEGELLTDTEGYNDVLHYIHSTFDNTALTNKFYPQGSSLIITDDGILSNCSSGNYVNCPIDALHDLVLDFELTTGNDVSNLGILQTTNWGFVFDYNFRYMKTDNGVYAISLNLQPNTKYRYRVITSGNTIKLYINGVLTVDRTDYKSPEITSIQLGVHSGVPAYLTSGSIDLKTVSIYSNGQFVLNCNQTGIDVIKPDNYTLASSLSSSVTVTTDGTASGFTGTAYVTDTVSVNANEPFTITGRITTGADVNTLQAFLGINQDSSSSILLSNRVYNGKIVFTYAISGSNAAIEIACTANTTYDYIIKYDGTNLIYTINGVEKTPITTFYSAKFGVVNIGRDRSGAASGFEVPFLGSVDLNAFKIYVNGELKYQPCLKIPYTETKTGSKVVDSYYRNRVKDMYEYSGYAPYYTLSDIDFTVPMGELYGLINNKKEIINYLCQTHFEIGTRNSYSIIRPMLSDINIGDFVIGAYSITIPKDGTYIIAFNCQKGTNSDSGGDSVRVLMNEDICIYEIVDDSSNGAVTGFCYASLKEGDLIRLYGYNFNTRAVSGDAYGTLSIRRIGNKFPSMYDIF